MKSATEKLATYLETFILADTASALTDGGDWQQLATDLIDWYNIMPESLDLDDLCSLGKLAEQGRFSSWDCPTCGDRCFMGDPEDWGGFQGVCQQDYTSYPAGSRKQCDSCRCYNPLQDHCPHCGESLDD